jgi:hypothetical protein
MAAVVMPMVGSRWRDIETEAEARIESLDPPTLPFDPPDTAVMVTIRHTAIVKAWDHTEPESTLRIPVEMFMHFWREFVPSLWERIGNEEEWLPN